MIGTLAKAISNLLVSAPTVATQGREGFDNGNGVGPSWRF